MDTTESQPLPEKPTIISRTASVLLILFSALMWFHMLSALATCPQQFEDVFDRFDIVGGLPAATRWTIAASHFLEAFWWVFALLGLAPGAALIWVGLTKRRVGLLAILAAGTFVGTTAVGFCMLACLFMPLIELIEAIGAAD